MNLQELLTTKVKHQTTNDSPEIEIIPNFRVSVQGERDDGVHFIIHPNDYNGNTLDFIVRGNQLEQI